MLWGDFDLRFKKKESRSFHLELMATKSGNLRALSIVDLIFAITNCIFLTDLRSKTMRCYTFSVRPTIPESKNVKIPMKKFDEEENEDFFEE